MRIHSIALLLGVTAFAACSSDDESGAKKATGGASGQSGASGTGGTSGNGGSADAGTDSGADAATDAPADGPGSATLDELCAPLKQEMCDWLVTCRANFLGDCDAWWGTQNVQAICTQGKAAVAKGHLAFDPVKAGACLDNATDFACSEGIPAAAFLGWQNVVPNACNGVFKGTVPTGGDCHPYGFASECATGYCKPGTCPGKCTPYVNEGGSCDFANLCEPGVAYCDSNENKCKKYVPAGGTCTQFECTPGLSCVETSETAKTCVSLKLPGASCTYPRECSESICVGGKCVAQVASGATCVLGVCPAGEQCDLGNSVVTGTCKPYPGVGQACKDNLCASPLHCSQGKCYAPGAAGDDCTVADCGAGLYCHTSAGKNSCKALGKVGQACGDDSPATIPNLVPARCDEGLRCVPKALDAGNQPTAWECQPPAAMGKPCNVKSQLSCAQGFCDPATNTCTTPSGPSGPCVDGALASCTAGNYCNGASKTCAPKIATGQPCTSNVSCTSGKCDINVTDKCIDLCLTE